MFKMASGGREWDREGRGRGGANLVVSGYQVRREREEQAGKVEVSLCVSVLLEFPWDIARKRSKAVREKKMFV